MEAKSSARGEGGGGRGGGGIVHSENGGEAAFQGSADEEPQED